MKKKCYTVFVIMCMITVIFLGLNMTMTDTSANESIVTISDENYTMTLQYLLYPYVRDEVEKTFGKSAQTDFYDLFIRKIEINSDSQMIVEVETQPYIGPHTRLAKIAVIIAVEPNSVKVVESKIINKYF